jgi:hypothetical protein
MVPDETAGLVLFVAQFATMPWSLALSLALVVAVALRPGGQS